MLTAIGAASCGAPRPERIDPNFYLEEMLGSKSKRNYGFYNNPKYDEAVRAQQEEMDPDQARGPH